MRPDLAAVAAVDQRDEQLAGARAPVQHAVHREIGVDGGAHGGEVHGGGGLEPGGRPGDHDPATELRQAGFRKEGKPFAKIVLAGVGVPGQRRADGDPGRAAAGQWGAARLGRRRRAWQRHLAALDRDQQLLRRLARLAVQFFRQRLFQQAELPQGRRLVAPKRVEAHDELMRQLVAGLDPHQLLGHPRIPEGIGGDQLFQLVRQRRGQHRPQLRPLDLQPGLEDRCIGMRWPEQLALPQCRCRQQRVLVMRAGGDQLAESPHVQIEGRSLQRDREAVRLDQILVPRSQHLAQFAQRLPQARPRQSFRGGVPQQRGQLFPIHPLAGGQQKQPQQAARLARLERDLLARCDAGDPARAQEIDVKPEHAGGPPKPRPQLAQGAGGFQQASDTLSCTILRLWPRGSAITR